eukprot:g53475.t1
MWPTVSTSRKAEEKNNRCQKRLCGFFLTFQAQTFSFNLVLNLLVISLFFGNTFRNLIQNLGAVSPPAYKEILFLPNFSFLALFVINYIQDISFQHISTRSACIPPYPPYLRTTCFRSVEDTVYSTLLYSTLLYSTLLYSTLLYSTLLYSNLI